MTKDTRRAEHTQMDHRALSAKQFFEVTGAEIIPFVSDEATWYDFDYLAVEELAEIVESHYGVVINESMLTTPFWSFLDFLEAHRTDAH